MKSAVAETAEGRKFTRASSLPRVQSEFNIIRLFKIKSGDVLLASMQTPVEALNRELQVRFKKDVTIPAQGVFQLGTSCALRTIEGETGARNYFMSALPRTEATRIEAGTELLVQKINVAPGQLSAQLSAGKGEAGRVEMICANPKIQDWTVTSFEVRTRGVLELRSNIQRDPASESHGYRLPGLSLASLTGHELNGYFGSGLPGTSGVQLLIGSNPQAFAHNDNRALWVGNRCAVLGDESSNNTARYAKDSKYAYVGRVVDAERGKVRFEFRNWGYSLENLVIECNGSPAEVLTMNTSTVESDLNQSVHFYSK